MCWVVFKTIVRKWGAFLWPIDRNEWRKFFSMAALMFLILLNQNLIRSLKDSLVITHIGAESLSFIKLFIEMPVGILFVYVYTTLCSNSVKMAHIFRAIVLFFLLFFIVFAFLLFPYQAYFHPLQEVVTTYSKLYPHLKWFFMIWSKWTLVIFYAMGELWPVVVFTLLYWQLANKITSTEEASRFYFLFNLFGQANLLVSGNIVVYCSHNNHCLLPLLTSFGMNGHTVQIVTLMIVVIGLTIGILWLHRYIEQYVVPAVPLSGKLRLDRSLPLGFLKSFKFILRSKYLLLICLLMLAYSMTINLIEGLWNHEVKCFYTQNSMLFMAYQGRILRWTGIVTLVCSLIGNMVLRKLGWAGVALITPMITLVVGGIFFFLVIVKQWNYTTVAGIPILAIIVAMGGLQNVLAKGSKYCFFDVTKEMAYIPLDSQMKTKGKAAVDILGGKLGKACGSILQVICYTIFSSYQPDQLSPYLMIIFCCVCIIWIIASQLLAKQYNQLLARK